jgi:glycosyltransferase involved in cell wall biosynthesis
MSKPFIIAAIPAFNEEKTIAKVVILAQKYVDKVIVCDDGSTDMTGKIAEKLGAEVLNHERNLGYGAALASLFDRAKDIGADIMVTLDGDGQHNPCDIPKLIGAIAKGEAEIVIGSRFLNGENYGVPNYRKAGIKFITKLASNLTYNELTDAQSGFRAYSKRALDVLRPSEMGMGASTEILIKAHEAGLKLKEVPTEISYIEHGSTHNPVSHGVEVVLSTIKHLSINRPLLFYGVPGFFSILVASFFWLWTLDTFVKTRQVVTNITLIAIGASIVGLMLLTTGVMLWVLTSIVRETARGRR